MMAYNKTNVQENSAMEDFAFGVEPLRAFSSLTTARIPKSTLGLLVIGCTLTLLTFLIASCAFQLKQSKDPAASPRRLANRRPHCPDTGQHSSFPHHDEPRGHGARHRRNGMTSPGAARSPDEGQGHRPTRHGLAAANVASEIAIRARDAVASAVSRAANIFSSPGRAPPEQIPIDTVYDFPRIDSPQGKSGLYEVLLFLGGLQTPHEELVERTFSFILWGILFEITLSEQCGSPGWPSRENLRNIAEKLEHYCLEAVESLLENSEASSYSTRASFVTRRRHSLVGHVRMNLIALRPPPYS